MGRNEREGWCHDWGKSGIRRMTPDELAAADRALNALSAASRDRMALLRDISWRNLGMDDLYPPTHEMPARRELWSDTVSAFNSLVAEYGPYQAVAMDIRGNRFHAGPYTYGIDLARQ